MRLLESAVIRRQHEVDVVVVGVFLGEERRWLGVGGGWGERGDGARVDVADAQAEGAEDAGDAVVRVGDDGGDDFGARGGGGGGGEAEGAEAREERDYVGVEGVAGVAGEPSEEVGDEAGGELRGAGVGGCEEGGEGLGYDLKCRWLAG